MKELDTTVAHEMPIGENEPPGRQGRQGAWNRDRRAKDGRPTRAHTLGSGLVVSQGDGAATFAGDQLQCVRSSSRRSTSCAFRIRVSSSPGALGALAVFLSSRRKVDQKPVFLAVPCTRTPVVAKVGLAVPVRVLSGQPKAVPADGHE